MDTLGIVDQVVIVVLGPLSIYLVNSPSAAHRKWGAMAGMVAQPFWFHAAYIAGQWGIFSIEFLYVLSWWQGIKQYWIKGGTNEI